MRKEKTKCMTPSCPDLTYSRGVCQVCYIQARNLVVAGHTTWLDLEKAGKVKEVSKRCQVSRQWFSAASESNVD